ncbi:MAG: ribonuclease E/G, partial [Acidimicrobiales bacterium]|nr:ribonuclease E/G [Acidimicrobiales bacterium]
MGQPASAGTADRKPQIGDSRPAPKPQIGDSRPAPQGSGGENRTSQSGSGGGNGEGGGRKRRRRRGGRGRGRGGQGGGQNSDRGQPVEAVTDDGPIELDEATLKSRRGRERRGRPIGRYLMCVSASDGFTQLAILEGRALIEHYLSRPADDVGEIHGNVYLAKVQNVLPGMEAAFVDIGTPKNAVLYRGDLQFDAEDLEGGQRPRIEQVLRARQTIIAQVTKNPIAHKGARLTQEIS